MPSSASRIVSVLTAAHVAKGAKGQELVLSGATFAYAAGSFMISMPTMMVCSSLLDDCCTWLQNWDDFGELVATMRQEAEESLASRC